MSTLLVIMSWEGAKEQVFRQWPYYKLPGWDILGLCPENSFHSWPHDINHCELVGKSSGYSTPDTVKYWVGTWERVLRPAYDSYTDFFVTEFDSLFLRPPPPHPGGLFTHMAGGQMDGFKASRFFHTPWWGDRKAAQIIVDEGRKLINQGDFEHGSPDVFLGLILDHRTDIKITETGTFSVNGGDLMNRKDEAEKSIRDPECWFLHGLKTAEELNWVTETLRDANTIQTA